MSEVSPENVEAAWKRVWNEYLERDDFGNTIQAHRDERRVLYRLLTKCVQAARGHRSKVLEVGSGTGIDSYVLAEMTGAAVYGCDLLEESVALSNKLAPYFHAKVEFFVDDARELNLESESFDVVFSQGVLEHFLDPTKLIEEQIRILRPGGFLVVDVPQRFSFYTIHKKRQMRRGTWEYGWETQYSYRQLRRLGQTLGLECVDRGGYGFEGKRDGGLGYLRNLHRSLGRVPLARTLPYRAFFKLWELIWRSIEDIGGHLFLISVAVVFRKPVDEDSLRQ